MTSHFDPNRTLVCSFCGKSQGEVMKIVSGPSVHICNECIQICNDIIASECGKDPDKETGSQSLSPLGLEEVLAWLNKNSFRVTLASRPRWRFSLSR